MSEALELKIGGMTCSGCASAVGRVLARVAGVARASVELESGRAVVEGAPRIEDLIRAVEAAGYEAEPWRPESSAYRE